jgi:hypothetical protein
VDLTWELQRARLQRKRLVRTERVASLRTVIFSILDPGSNPVRATIDATACRIAEKWGRGDTKEIKRVDELLAQAGLSMAEVDLQSLSTESSELERLDERDERLAKRRDEILRQIERRRSGWAKLVRRASEEVIEGEFHELPSGAPDIDAGPDVSDGRIRPGSTLTRKG